MVAMRIGWQVAMRVWETMLPHLHWLGFIRCGWALSCGLFTVHTQSKLMLGMFRRRYANGFREIEGREEDDEGGEGDEGREWYEIVVAGGGEVDNPKEFVVDWRIPMYTYCGCIDGRQDDSTTIKISLCFVNIISHCEDSLIRNVDFSRLFPHTLSNSLCCYR